MPKLGFFISYFAQTEKRSSLNRLIKKLDKLEGKIVIIENNDFHAGKAQLAEVNGIKRITRENLGMNIGAWREGWKLFDTLDYYFFFQAESYIKKLNFASHYINIFRADPSIGLIGDSLNTKWAHSWSKLERSQFNTEILIQPNSYEYNSNHQGSQPKKERRVTFYRKKLEEWGIKTHNQNAAHIRALNWCTTRDILNKIEFPIGHSYHECIAAEIAVSRAVIQAGYKVSQSHQIPFKYIGHSEWQGNSKIQPYTTKPPSFIQKLIKIAGKQKRSI